jgi:hypothetical protein
MAKLHSTQNSTRLPHPYFIYHRRVCQHIHLVDNARNDTQEQVVEEHDVMNIDIGREADVVNANGQSTSLGNSDNTVHQKLVETLITSRHYWDTLKVTQILYPMKQKMLW